MLSLFPQILFLAPFSALLIRVALAVVFAYAAWKHMSIADMVLRGIGIVEVAVAAALFVGFSTQAASCVAVLLVVTWLLLPSAHVYSRSTMYLALVMSLSLIITGAGALAFDLPL